MKINTINNNNYRVSHKAHFKQNTEFHKLCDSQLTYLKSDLIDKFKKLPNHEIEILSIQNLNFSTDKIIGLFNHSTKKFKDFRVESGYLLKYLIESLCSTEGNRFFSDEDSHKKNFMDLTSK